MTNGNGRGPIPFPPPQSVPIVGQPFTLKSGYVTVLIQCNCDAKEPIVLVASLPTPCRSCGRTFATVTAAVTADGEISAHIGLLQQPTGTPS